MLLIGNDYIVSFKKKKKSWDENIETKGRTTQPDQNSSGTMSSFLAFWRLWHHLSSTKPGQPCHLQSSLVGWFHQCSQPSLADKYFMFLASLALWGLIVSQVFTFKVSHISPSKAPYSRAMTLLTFQPFPKNLGPSLHDFTNPCILDAYKTSTMYMVPSSVESISSSGTILHQSYNSLWEFVWLNLRKHFSRQSFTSKCPRGTLFSKVSLLNEFASFTTWSLQQVVLPL